MNDIIPYTPQEAQDIGKCLITLGVPCPLGPQASAALFQQAERIRAEIQSLAEKCPDAEEDMAETFDLLRSIAFRLEDVSRVLFGMQGEAIKKLESLVASACEGGG